MRIISSVICEWSSFSKHDNARAYRWNFWSKLKKRKSWLKPDTGGKKYNMCITWDRSEIKIETKCCNYECKQIFNKRHPASKEKTNVNLRPRFQMFWNYMHFNISIPSWRWYYGLNFLEQVALLGGHKQAYNWTQAVRGMPDTWSTSLIQGSCDLRQTIGKKSRTTPILL